MATVGKYNMPDELYYHKEHMWVRIISGPLIAWNVGMGQIPQIKKEDVIGQRVNIAQVGVDDFTQQLAGEASYLDLPGEGDAVKADDRVGTMETGKWLGKLFAPVSGKIIKKNSAVEDEATLVNKDPYGQGWLFEIEMSDPSEVSKLMQGQAVLDWLNAEIAKHEPK